MLVLLLKEQWAAPAHPAHVYMSTPRVKHCCITPLHNTASPIHTLYAKYSMLLQRQLSRKGASSLCMCAHRRLRFIIKLAIQIEL
jgi:hypothetical protein